MKIAPHPHVFGNTDLGKIRPADFSNRRLQELEDEEDQKPNTRALWTTCAVYLVLVVAVISLVKWSVTGSVW